MKWMTNKITGVGRCLLLTLWESASIGKDGSFHCGISRLGSLVSIRLISRKSGLCSGATCVWEKGLVLFMGFSTRFQRQKSAVDCLMSFDCFKDENNG